ETARAQEAEAVGEDVEDAHAGDRRPIVARLLALLLTALTTAAALALTLLARLPLALDLLLPGGALVGRPAGRRDGLAALGSRGRGLSRSRRLVGRSGRSGNRSLGCGRYRRGLLG